MTSRDIIHMKSGSVIYDEHLGNYYTVLEMLRVGVKTCESWSNSYGTYIRNVFFTYEELLNDDNLKLV